MNIKDTWPIPICLLFPNLELLVKSDHPFLGEQVKDAWGMQSTKYFYKTPQVKFKVIRMKIISILILRKG